MSQFFNFLFFPFFIIAIAIAIAIRRVTPKLIIDIFVVRDQIRPQIGNAISIAIMIASARTQLQS